MKVLLLAVVLLLTSSFLVAQTWNSSIDLNLAVDSGDRIDLYTNMDGNHILVHEGNQVKYYLYSYDGSAVRNSTIVSSIDEDTRMAKITGYLDTLYISYQNGGYIYTKRSSDAGQNWSSNIQNIIMTNSTSNGFELWADENGLHIAWSEYDSGNDDYDTYYKRLPNNSNYWTDSKNVTDSSGDNGGFPSLTTSASRVHVAYTQGDDNEPQWNWGTDSKIRDKYSSTWQTPATNSTNTSCSMIIANSSKLHLFYYDFHYDEWSHLSYQNLLYKNRDLGSSSWTSSAELYQGVDPLLNPVDMAVMQNGNVGIAIDGTRFSEYDGEDWFTFYQFGDGWGTCQKIAANSNDLYFIWIQDDGNGGDEVRLRQRDMSPLTPTNIAMSIQSGHPHITWTANKEADLQEYEIWKMKTDTYNWALRATTTNTYYTDTAEDVEARGDYTAYYKLKGVDAADNQSDFSSTVSIRVENGLGLGKKIVQVSDDIPQSFVLQSNYPNPFNPVTTIPFDLPEANFTTLSIYNSLGQEVATLVNRELEAGRYQAEFDAGSLPSGVYFYRLTAGKFAAVKRMLLIK
jgi:hypothetical protein